MVNHADDGDLVSLIPLIERDDDDGEAFEQSEDEHEVFSQDSAESSEEEEATPTKRRKTGLLSAPSTPSRSAKRATATKPRTPKASPAPIDPNAPGFIRPTRADAYFLAAGRSARTSGNPFASQVPPLTQSDYDRYTRSARRNGKAKADLDDVEEKLVERFEQWETELLAGFNILLYGYGSKRRLLNRMVNDSLRHKGHCVVVNGLFPAMNIRTVLAQIEESLELPITIDVPETVTSTYEKTAHRIYSYFVPSEAKVPSKSRYQTADAPLFLVIHNLDAPGLRSPRALGILALLASCPRIHLLACVDHANASLLFSSSSTSALPHEYPPKSFDRHPQPVRGFNWLWHHAATFADYDLELEYQRLAVASSALALGGTAQVASEDGARHVLRSVTLMAQRLFKLLATKQLAALPSDTASHTAFPPGVHAPVYALEDDLLQSLAKAKFIAREEDRYNSQMGEFKDHGLVVGADLDSEGRQGKWVWIPLSKASLERVVETLKDVEA
jgi:origin recognition complex subunit 2